MHSSHDMIYDKFMEVAYDDHKFYATQQSTNSSSSKSNNNNRTERFIHASIHGSDIVHIEWFQFHVFMFPEDVRKFKLYTYMCLRDAVRKSFFSPSSRLYCVSVCHFTWFCLRVSLWQISYHHHRHHHHAIAFNIYGMNWTGRRPLRSAGAYVIYFVIRILIIIKQSNIAIASDGIGALGGD